MSKPKRCIGHSNRFNFQRSGCKKNAELPSGYCVECAVEQAHFLLCDFRWNDDPDRADREELLRELLALGLEPGHLPEQAGR